MQAIYFLAVLGLAWLHLAALTALCGPRLGSWALAKGAGVLAVTMVMFFVEHFHGFGALHGLWPFTTALAAALLYRRRQALANAGFWGVELAFAACVAYALAWRWAFPSIYPTSERLTDLYFIVNYLPGSTLPPPDHWFAPHRFDYYYALQHYGAALLGRLFSLSPGLTYNLAFALLMGLALSLVWDFASQHLRRVTARLLLVAAVACGGTGATVFTYLVKSPVASDHPVALANEAGEFMWGAARFVGTFDQGINTALGQRLFPSQATADFKPRELPLESFGYQYFVGDYHPPVGGFFLLFLALAAMSRMALLPEGREPGTAQAWWVGLLGLTTAAQLATNTWVFPLHAALTGGWLAWLVARGRLRWPEAAPYAAGAVLGVLLLLPFLQNFFGRGDGIRIVPVKAGDHTPLPQFLALTWPLLILLAAAFWQRGARGFTRFIALAVTLLLVFSELFFADDRSGGHYERTNTVMKWWGFLWSCGIAALGVMLLAAPSQAVRALTAVALAGVLTYGFSIARFWYRADLTDAGALHGDAVYARDVVTRDTLHALRHAPRGLVLARQRKHSYDDGVAYAAFSGQPMLLGWPHHLDTWLGYHPAVWNRHAEINAFYLGALPDPRHWLQRHDVRYIVWTPQDAADAAVFAQLQQALAADYDWTAFSAEGVPPAGLWTRRTPP
jgi:uncharacterized membrane protein